MRLLDMSARRDRVLSGGDRVPSLPLVPLRAPVPWVSSNSGEESEDEPLSVRVRVDYGFKSSTLDRPSQGSESALGDTSSSEGSESEAPSEEDSELKSDSKDDDVIYLGRENLLSKNLSQGLLLRWLLPVATAVEI